MQCEEGMVKGKFACLSVLETYAVRSRNRSGYSDVSAGVDL